MGGGCRVELGMLGLDGAQVGRCRALVLQLPGEAAAALHRLRSRLLPGGPAGASKLSGAVDHLQVGHRFQSATGTVGTLVTRAPVRVRLLLP